MQHLASYLYLIGYSFAIFVLISLGLAVIFGMMRVINLAQGEFLMLGAYVCVEATKAGLALWLAIIVAGMAVGAFGIVVERLIIRFLYGRILDTLLATWGLSLFLVGGVTILFGPQSVSVGATLGNFQIGDISYSRYSLIVIVVAVLLLIGDLCALALHPLRPHRARHDAECRHGQRHGHQHRPCVHAHLRFWLGPDRTGRCGAGPRGRRFTAAWDSPTSPRRSSP